MLDVGMAACSQNRLGRKIALERRELDLARLSGKEPEVRERIKTELMELLKGGDEPRKTLLATLKDKTVWQIASPTIFSPSP